MVLGAAGTGGLAVEPGGTIQSFVAGAVGVTLALALVVAGKISVAGPWEQDQRPRNRSKSRSRQE